jgi:Ig-like domain CHU_C associated
MRILTLSLSFALLLLNPLRTNGQVTIDDTDMPHAGDELLRTRAASNPFLNYSATGAGHVWDFDNLVAQEQQTKAYQTVGSTNFIYALLYSDLFFNPNRANHATDGVDIPFYEQLPIADPYTFYYRSGSVYKKVGYGAEVAGFPVPIPMDDHDVIYELPLEYGDASTSISNYQIDIPTLAYYGFSQTRTNEVDGWGAISTPAGSFDVLRVKTTLAGRDSISLDTLSIGFAIERPLVTEYKWLAHGQRVPILQINTTEIFGLEIVTEVWFYDEPRTLEVVEPFTLSLCPGDEIQVPYAATGAFNQGGFLVQPNQFRAQLSDANGDFTNAVNIGSVTATTSGVIDAIIPANTPLGISYRIRVVATNPEFVGTDNGQDISIGLPPSADLSAFGTTTFCAGGEVLLQANLIGTYDYQWQVDGNNIPGANGNEYTATNSGSYSVVVSNACGSDASDEIDVSVTEVPAHTLMQDVFAACAGDDITLTAIDLSGQTDIVYQWLLEGAAIPGATNPSYNATFDGSFSVQATNSVTGCAFTTDQTVLVFDPLPVNAITAASATTFCSGGSVLLNTDDVTDAAYQWSLDGVAIDGATTSFLVVDTTGAYSVLITTSAGCSAYATNTIDVQVLDAPPTITIAANDATAFCAGGSVLLSAEQIDNATYQWYQDGQLMDGAIVSSLIVSATGTYSVTITTAGGCSANSTNTMDVVVFEAPEVPVISADGAVLNSSGDGSFQWYLDGAAIEGATGFSHATTSNGSYSVQVTDANGCSTMSDPFVFLTTGIDERTTLALSLYPNPTRDHATLTGDAVLGTIRILDVSGRIIRNERCRLTSHTLNLDGMAAGNYTVVSDLGAVRLILE